MDPCVSAPALVWDEDAARLVEHLHEESQDDGGWTRVLRCPSSETLWVEDSPLSDLHGGGPRRLRALPLPPLCQCRTKDDLTGVIAAVYEREHLVWVRYLGGGLDLRACADGLAAWEDGVLDGVRRLRRVWVSDGAPLRPWLAESVSRGRTQ